LRQADPARKRSSSNKKKRPQRNECEYEVGFVRNDAHLRACALKIRERRGKMYEDISPIHPFFKEEEGTLAARDIGVLYVLQTRLSKQLGLKDKNEGGRNGGRSTYGNPRLEGGGHWDHVARFTTQEARGTERKLNRITGYRSPCREGKTQQ